MGCQYRAHINTHLGPMWVLYFLLAGSAGDRLNSFFLFITKKTGFDISCSGDNLHEVQILFS